MKTAFATYEQCQKDLAKAENDVVDIKAQVAQASTEKADFEAPRLGAKAGDIMTSLVALADKCGDGALGEHLRKAIAVASAAETIASPNPPGSDSLLASLALQSQRREAQPQA